MSWLSQVLNKPKAQPNTPSGNVVKDLTQSGLSGIIDKGVALFRGSSTGQAVENRAIAQGITEVVYNPVTWLAVGAVVLVLLWRK